jgi:hypothetical protein
MENYDFYISDTVVAVGGSQNVTFSYAADSSPILQRIDRRWQLSGLCFDHLKIVAANKLRGMGLRFSVWRFTKFFSCHSWWR